MARRTRTRLFIPLGLIALAVALLLVARWDRIRNWYRPPTADLPAADDIVAMRAQVWASGSRGHYETGVPEIDVRPPMAQRIWRRFEGGEYVADPPVLKDLPLGELVVTTRGGETIRLTFFEAGPEKLVFTRDGKRVFQSEPRTPEGNPLGGGIALGGTLRHVWATVMWGEGSTWPD